MSLLREPAFYGSKYKKNTLRKDTLAVHVFPAHVLVQ
jgi:hypothetical protein